MHTSFTYQYIFIFLLFLSAFPLSSQAQLPEGFNDELVSADWSAPVGLVFDDEGRQYVWEKAGKVYIVEEDQRRVILDIEEEVVNWRDHGLMSVALHPNFLENGWMYVYYAVDRHHLLFYGMPEYDPNESIIRQATIARVAKYTMDVKGDFQADPDSRDILIGETIDQGIPLLHESHGAGTLMFGTDGSLLLSTGDGSTGALAYFGGEEDGATFANQALQDGILRPKEDIGSFRSQLVDALNGKMLRIDPMTGDGIPSNPFYDASAPRAPKSRVWALGLRNPFRFTIKPGTGSHEMEDGDPGVLYVGDVGWGWWEEINVISEGGQNFGWPLYEGFEQQWHFGAAEIVNPDAPRTATNECEEAFYFFEDLVVPTEGSKSTFINVCSGQYETISDAQVFVHTQPIVSWNNKSWNPPARTFVPRRDGSTDEKGNLAHIQIGDSASPVSGTDFEGVSALGGVFYTGDNFPPEYALSFIAADFEQWLKKMDFGPGNELLAVEDFHENVSWIVDLKIHPLDGTLYYVLHNVGEVRKISFGGNAAPIPVIEVDQYYGAGPLSIQFSGAPSSDPENGTLTYLWDFGDGSGSTEMNPDCIPLKQLPQPQLLLLFL